MLKKLVSFLLILVLSLSLCACGGSGTGNPDHDYVIALMEKGDYAMAIKVLENLRGETDSSEEVPAGEVSVEEPAPTAEPAPSLTEIQQLAVDTVANFMAEKGEAMIRRFEEETAGKAREPRVINAMEYHLADVDGKGGVAHCLMIAVQADICVDNGIYDSVQMLVDLDSGAVYNSTELDEALLNRGEPANREELNTFLLNGYFSHLMFGEGVWANVELREEFTEADLAAINEALWK